MNYRNKWLQTANFSLKFCFIFVFLIHLLNAQTLLILKAPDDVVISCQFKLDTHLLSDIHSHYLGGLSSDSNNIQPLIIQDIVCKNYCNNDAKHHYPGTTTEAGKKACEYFQNYFNPSLPNNMYNLNYGRSAYTNSPNNIKIQINDHRSCGLGLIERIYSVNNIPYLVSDTQRIYVVECSSPFINVSDPCDPNDDLDWMYPYCDSNYILKIDDCQNIQNPLSAPKLLQRYCNLLSLEYTDEIYAGIEGCFYIRRTYTIIDWCAYDPFIDPNIGRWKIVQTLQVIDHEKPIVQYGIGNGKVTSKRDGICYTNIQLTASAMDGCTPSDFLIWKYKIDLNNDAQGKHNGYDIEVGKLNKIMYSKNDTPAIADNPYADNRFNPFDASGTYPLGIHKICWFVEDGCGNVGVICTLFEAKDSEAPHITTQDSFIYSISTSGCIDILAKDLVASSEDNCTLTEHLKYFFNGDPSTTSIRICCEDLIDKATCGYEIHLRPTIHVQDEAGNTGIIETNIIVYDELLVCERGNTRTRRYSCTTIKNNSIQGVKVYQKETFDHLAGYFRCNNEFMGSICPLLPIRISHSSYYGQDVLDLILLQEYLNGKRQFSFLQKHLSDLNNSNTITTADRAILLHSILERNPRDWSFFTLPDTIPLTKQTNYICPDSCKLLGAMNGDLNFDALSYCGDSLWIPDDCIQFVLEKKPIDIDKTMSIPVYCVSQIPMKGFQFDLNTKDNLFELLEISSDQSNLKFNFSSENSNDGIQRILCTEKDANAFIAEPTKPLFSLKIISKVSSSSELLINLNESYKENIGYDSSYYKYKICMNYVVSSKDHLKNKDILIFPIQHDGNLIISNTSNSPIRSIEIFNSEGKLIQTSRNFNVNSEIYEIPFSSSDGIYFVHITTSDFNLVKKIVCFNN